MKHQGLNALSHRLFFCLCIICIHFSQKQQKGFLISLYFYGHTFRLKNFQPKGTKKRVRKFILFLNNEVSQQNTFVSKSQTLNTEMHIYYQPTGISPHHHLNTSGFLGQSMPVSGKEENTTNHGLLKANL